MLINIHQAVSSLLIQILYAQIAALILALGVGNGTPLEVEEEKLHDLKVCFVVDSLYFIDFHFH